MANVRTTHEGQLNFSVFDAVSSTHQVISVKCANLDDGSRVIAESDFLVLLGRTSTYRKNDKKNSCVNLPPFLQANNLQPFIREDFPYASIPIKYISKSNVISRGYLASLLPEVCQVYKRAKRANALRVDQEHIFRRCDLIIDSLAEVGIVALVDEATGYQYDRPKDTLQALLELYVQKDPRPWEKQFTEKFYKGICKLRGWEYNPKNRTSAFSYVTVDLIYKRIQPKLWEELKKSNPNKQKYRYHQLLTENIGNSHLQEHLRGIIRLMDGASNWNMFMATVNHFYPINNIQMDLFFDLLIQSPEDFDKYKDLVS
jgi:hypothetical protein